MASHDAYAEDDYCTEEGNMQHPTDNQTIHIVVWFESKRGICVGGVFRSREDADRRRQEVYEELHELDVRFEGLRIASLNIQEPDHGR